MPLPFEVEAQIMERRHINLRHMTFIFDEHLYVIFPYIYPSFNGECPNSKEFINNRRQNSDTL